MTRLLIHGLYDAKTLETLKSSVACHFAFDLRARSPNLVPFHQLLQLLKNLPTETVYLTFEDDRPETIHSILNMLKNEPFRFHLIFRDHQSVRFYEQLGLPYLWMFNPQGDWRSILNTTHVSGVLLPMKWQQSYENNSELWNLIEYRNLEVFIHADSFAEAASIEIGANVKLSLDLTSEIETGFRKVDQDKLKVMKLWSKF